MPATLAIDVRNSFATALLMACGPKLEYGTGAQATSAQGVAKWEAQIAVTYLAEPGMRAQSEVLAVTFTQAEDPGKDIAPGTAVEFDRLRVGGPLPSSAIIRGIRGGKPWYQATGLRPSLMTGNRGKSEAAA